MPDGLSPCRGRQRVGRGALAAGRGAKTAGRSSEAGLAPTAFSNTPGPQIRLPSKAMRKRVRHVVAPTSRQVARFYANRAGGRMPVSGVRLRLVASRESQTLGRLRGQHREGGGPIAQPISGEKNAVGQSPVYCTKDDDCPPLSRAF